MSINKSKTTKISKITAQLHKLNAANYQDVWDFQTVLHNKLKEDKRKSKTSLTPNEQKILNHVIFCQHKPVYTLGKSADSSNLLRPQSDLVKEGFEIYHINRGGDITYHGPGQVTGYLIMDLELLYRDVHRYVRNIEEVIIRTLGSYMVEGIRLDDFTGVWVKHGGKLKKICAIGVHLSRWVSMHGFGFNVNTELYHFNNIIPCGIDQADKEVTSLSDLLNRDIKIKEVEAQLIRHCQDVFQLEFINNL